MVVAVLNAIFSYEFLYGLERLNNIVFLQRVRFYCLFFLDKGGPVYVVQISLVRLFFG